jgi:hypothetical protein
VTPGPGGQPPNSQITTFLYCNHQVHREFLITLYMNEDFTWAKYWHFFSEFPDILRLSPNAINLQLTNAENEQK